MMADTYTYKLTGTDADGRRFTKRGPGNYLAAHNVYRGNLWESVNGGPWRKVRTWSN